MSSGGNCETYRDLFSPFMDGELDGERDIQIREHLDCCLACREEVETLRSLSDTMRKIGSETPPPPSWDTILERVPGTVLSPAAASSPPARSQPGSLQRVLSVAAILILGIGIGAVLSSWLTGRQGPPIPMTAEPAEDEPAPSGGHGLSPADLFLAVVTVPGQVPWLTDQLLSRSEEIPLPEVRSPETEARAGFRPIVPSSLPGGFTLSKCQLLSTGCCRAMRLRYRRGEDVVDLIQQPEGAPVNWQQARLQRCVISGQKCRQRTDDHMQLVQLAADGVNVLVLSSNRKVPMGPVVQSLVSWE